jgi:hypothetical protein
MAASHVDRIARLVVQQTILNVKRAIRALFLQMAFAFHVLLEPRIALH